MTRQIVIAGGGIGGLAAAVACTRAGWQVQLVEQAAEFAEAGAGIQLGPNATRILQAGGLGDALAAVASEPALLRVRAAASHRSLACMPLGAAMRSRYGAPYCTVHRADLHRLLLDAAVAAGIRLHLQSAIKSIATDDGATLTSGIKHSENGIETVRQISNDALIGADGLWSTVRQHLLPGSGPQPTGHVAWRALLDAAALPHGVSAQEVSVWLGPKMHMVCYPVRGGRSMNLVLILEGHGLANDTHNWSQDADRAALEPLLRSLHATPVALLNAAPQWKQWLLHEHPPVPSAAAMARGRIALLGDAAHAMRPYLAQGGAMALEDAAQLERSLKLAGQDVPAALQHYAQARWQRNARVQRRARRNGVIFHASGPLRLARDMAMQVAGARLMDSPWLYRA